MDKEISELLYQLRIPASVKGFQLLKEAIKKVYEEQPLDLYMTLLYKEIAQKFNDTPPRVERGMRFAIESGWNKNNEGFPILNKYMDEKPTNSEFLALAVNYLRLSALS